MGEINFKDYFKELKDSGRKFVIIIGSKFYSTAIKEDSCLTSWSELIKSVDPNYKLNSQYNHFLIDFEKIIVSKTNSQTEKQASKIEDELLKGIAKELKHEQSKILKASDFSYIKKIFNKQYVSDVISLNFDLIPEIVLNQQKTPKAKILKEKPGNESEIQSTRHRAVGDINFWHPHGDIANYKSIILSVRRYCNHIGEIEHLRKRSKKSPRPEDYQESWYDKLLHNPILIIGAGISDAEWDLWNAITNRERNFAKGNYSKYKNPIFKMTGPSSGSSLEDYFIPLFDYSFAKQWQELIKLFEE